MKQGKILLFLMGWVGLLLPSLTLALEIAPGFSLFKTAADGDTFINLSSVGGPTKVPLQGNAKPLAKLNNQLLNRVQNVDRANLAAIDTVVEIKENQVPNLSKGDEITGELEMLVLSLKSIESLDIGFLNKFPARTRADLYVTVGIIAPNSDSTNKLSPGKMIARYENDNGGSFNFNLNINPELTFVKAGGDFNNPQDWLFTTPYPGEPINMSGDGTWHSENGMFVMDTIAIIHISPQEVHVIIMVASVTQKMVALTRPEILSLVALPSSGGGLSTEIQPGSLLPPVGTRTVMDANINTKVTMLNNPSLSTLFLETFEPQHIECLVTAVPLTENGFQRRDLQIVSIQEEFAIPLPVEKLGKSIKVFKNPNQLSTGTIISKTVNSAYPATQTVNLFVVVEANGMTLINKEPVIFKGEINQWPPHGSRYYQQKPVDFYMADEQLEPQGEAIMQFTGSEIQLFDHGGLVDAVANLTTNFKAGYDLFITPADGQTFIDLSSKGGPKKVLLKGDPAPFASVSEKLATVDTVVKRQGFNLIAGKGTAQIEVMALALKSIQPVDIGFLLGTEGKMADLYLTVNTLGLPGLPPKLTKMSSTGEMTVYQEEMNGGTLTGRFAVYPDLIFVRPNGDLNNPKDWLFLMPDSITPIILNSQGKWSKGSGNSPNAADLPIANDFVITAIRHDFYHVPVLLYTFSIEPLPPEFLKLQTDLDQVKILASQASLPENFFADSLQLPIFLNSLDMLSIEPPPMPLEPPPMPETQPLILTIQNIFISKKVVLSSNVLIPPKRLPVRFGSLALTREREDSQLFDATSQAFLTTLGESLATFNLTEMIVETNEEMKRLEVPLSTSPAWYSAFATDPVLIADQEQSVPGLLKRNDETVYLVFENDDHQLYESNLIPALDSDIAKALVATMPAAIIEQSLNGEILFALDDEVHWVKMDYVVTATESDTSQLNIVVKDVNEDGKVDYILSAVGKQQIAFGQ